MELQWDKIALPCFGLKVRQVQNQEQTLEVRLGDDMPDIGRIICGWGQNILRGKQWNSDHMVVSGGIMAYILYSPEDGSAPRCIQAWLPYSMKWNFDQSDRDGVIRANIHVKSVDARVLSSRKMMVRGCISGMGEALEPKEVYFYSGGTDQDHVHLLKRTYPVTVPVEVGEKTFLMDEDLELPGKRLEKIISITVEPKLAEQKAVGGKAVFRGECRVHLVYFDAGNEICSADLNVPFAQYADLDRDYDKDASVITMMVVTAMEPEAIDGLLRLKCGLTAQYVVMENRVLELTQDAYSTTHEIDQHMETLQLPVVLDWRRENQMLNQTGPCESMNVVDAACFMEHPVLRHNDSLLEGVLPGTVQVLCKNDSGQYYGSHIRFSYPWSIPAAEEADVCVMAQFAAAPSVTADGVNLHISVPVELETMATLTQQMDMICGLQIGRPLEQDVNRPSMILRRAGGESLWNLAKRYGSTVDAIKKVNDLKDHADEGRMLLIPIN